MEGTYRTQYWVTFAVGLVTLTSMVAFSWTTPVIPKLHRNETSIRITDEEISWLAVALSPGLVIGTFLTKYLSDNAGRRTTLLASALPFCAGTLFLLFASNVWMMYSARFFWGIGAGMIQTVAMVYLAEIASKEIRGKLSVINRFMFNVGGLLVIVVGTFVSYQTLSLMLIVFPVIYFVACLWIPETPYYLLKEKKDDKAMKCLKKLLESKDEKVIGPKLMDMKLHVQEEMKRSTSFKELFSGIRYRKAMIIGFVLRACQMMSGTVPLQQYMGRVMQDTRSSVPLSTALVLFGILKFLSSIISTGIIEKLGRRPLMISSFIGSSLSFFVVGICFILQDNDIVEDASLLGNVILFGIMCFTVISTIGFDTVIYIVPAEVFPLNVKSTAMTCVNLFGAVATFLAVRGFQVMKDLTGLCGVFWAYAGVCLVGALFTYTYVPETKGKSLREIQIELQGSYYLDEESGVKLMRDDKNKSETKS